METPANGKFVEVANAVDVTLMMLLLSTFEYPFKMIANINNSISIRFYLELPYVPLSKINQGFAKLRGAYDSHESYRRKFHPVVEAHEEMFDDLRKKVKLIRDAGV